MSRNAICVVLVAGLICLVSARPCAAADHHVVTPAELRAAIFQAANARRSNLCFAQ